MIKKGVFFSLNFFFIFLLLGCQSTSQKNIEVQKTEGQMNIGTTLGMSDETAFTDFNSTYIIPSQISFNPNIYIHNRDVKNNEFRLIFLLDYKQIDVKYNNKNVDYLDISTLPNEEKNLTIELPFIEDGFHDFLVLCIRNPDTLLPKEKFYPPGNFYVFKRSTLIVGNNYEKPNIEFSNHEVLPGEDSIPPIVTKHPRNEFEGSVITVLKQPYPETLWLNFSPIEPKMKYALIAFSGKKQIEVKNSFFETTSKGVINLPLQLNLNKGKENLVIAVVENPFNSIETRDGEISKEPLWVTFINRISLE